MSGKFFSINSKKCLSGGILRRIGLKLVPLLLLGVIPTSSQILDTALAGEGYRNQGEYYGTVGGKSYGIQVIDLSGGKFEMNIMPGGLPGQGWGSNIQDFVYIKSTSSGASGTVFVGSGTTAGWSISIPPGGKTLSGTNPTGGAISMKKIYRDSPTLGKAPPPGAIVLFDGTQASYSANWSGKAPYTVGANKYLSEGNNSTKQIADHTLHIEFRPPYEPDKDGQERGNSGVYVQGVYECQVLDSFGWMKGQQESGQRGLSSTWAGGLYQWSKPRLNMAHPPLTWQTYDVHVSSAAFNGTTKTARAHLTVYLNGYMVQDTTIAGPTPGGFTESATGGKLYVQNHGGPMWYRNVWVVTGKDFVPVPPLPALDGTIGLSPSRHSISPRSGDNRYGFRFMNGGNVRDLLNVKGSRVTGVGASRAAGSYVLRVASKADAASANAKNQTETVK